jgi:hypothetical protein
MKKELANNQELGTECPAMTRWEARMVLGGLAAAIATGGIIRPEMMKSLDDAVEALNLQAEDNGNGKPPKPPRGSARRVDDFALGNT